LQVDSSDCQQLRSCVAETDGCTQEVEPGSEGQNMDVSVFAE
jgi:hypothetical protein